MPNLLSETGIQTATRDELVAYFTAQYQAIYGPDINLESSTPDGQIMNIFIQAILDLEDLLVQIYNSFDPDNAIGNILDQRVTINGIQRQGGTYTVTPITVVTTQSVNLYGLDQDVEPVYTVADNAGNNWLLESTEIGIVPGVHSFSFRAATPGENLTIPNTITVPVTIVLGVSSVNNPTNATSFGQNEESDAALRVRRLKSVSLASQGYLAGLIAALENVADVSSVFVYENLTGITDSDGIPGHSIWVIVSGAGAPADIAEAIYVKRNAGCGMKGSQTYTITQVDGSPFVVRWDDVVTKNLFISFEVISINGTIPPNIEAIRNGLVDLLIPGVNSEVNINQIATLVQQIDPNALVLNAGISIADEQTLSLSGVAASGVFKLNYGAVQSADINWNDSIGTIQSKLQAMTGLSTATVTGSIASQSLVFNLSTLSDVTSLLFVSDNTLQTAGLADIAFEYDEDYAPILTPPSKQNQFVISAENIVITEMQLSPASAQVSGSQNVQFEALGGYGSYTYTLSLNASGATIDASTGLYTAGVSSGVDNVTATDVFGNTAVAIVTVV